MLPEERNAAYLWDMLTSCNEIHQFTFDKNLTDFINNKMLRYAVERLLLIPGEAAGKLSDSIIDSNPDIPWKKIIGLRHILAHDYGEVLAERIWLVVKQNLPDLIEKLKYLMPEPPV